MTWRFDLSVGRTFKMKHPGELELRDHRERIYTFNATTRYAFEGTEQCTTLRVRVFVSVIERARPMLRAIIRGASFNITLEKRHVSSMLTSANYYNLRSTQNLCLYTRSQQRAVGDQCQTSHRAEAHGLPTWGSTHDDPTRVSPTDGHVLSVRAQPSIPVSRHVPGQISMTRVNEGVEIQSVDLARVPCLGCRGFSIRFGGVRFTPRVEGCV